MRLRPRFWKAGAFVLAETVSCLVAAEGSANCTNPSNGTPLTNQNPSTATVLNNPQIYVVFLGLTSTNEPAGEIGLVTGFLQAIGGTKYLNTVTQYASFQGLPGTLRRSTWAPGRTRLRQLRTQAGLYGDLKCKGL